MTITHTVLFQLKPDSGSNNAKTVCEDFLGLKEKCLHPINKTPYILSIKGGKDNSIEGRQSGITHGFVVEFSSAADRDYYVNEDPAHRDFIETVKDMVDQAIVVDFTNGVYE